MSAMSELHAEVTEISTRGSDLVESSHFDSRSAHKWGLLDACEIIQTIRQAMIDSSTDSAHEALSMAHSAIMAAHAACPAPDRD